MTTLDALVPGIVDAHVHYTNPGRSSWSLARFERLAELSLKRLVPSPIARVAAKLAHGDDKYFGLDAEILRSPYQPAEYALDAREVVSVAGIGVDGIVAVESHWQVAKSPESLMESSYAEVEYLLGLSHGRHGPDLGAIISAVDPRCRTLATHLDRQRELSDKVRGVRFKWGRHPDPEVPDWCDEPDVLASTAFLAGFEAIAERELVFVSFGYSHQLGQLDMLARRFPETTIVIEHLGVPVGVFGPTGSRTGMTAAARAEILGLWRERMSMIAQRPNVMVNASGLGLAALGYGRERSGNIGSREVLADMIGPLVLHVVDRFGPDRVIFGSNSPVDRSNTSIGMTVGALLDVLGPRGPYLLEQVFARNAQRVYGLVDP